jgi:type III secretory pathway component EscR
MKWEEARNMYVNKWILLEAIDAYSEEGRRIVKEISVINAYDQGKEALKDYIEKHKKDKSREMYVYHTKNEKLFIEERAWIGVRKNG